MISYAQNAEDVVLARVFAGQASGRYVDLGAGYPVLDSVTKHFYDLGWRGINVEPEPTLAAELDRARPEDVNLRVAVGARPGTTVLHAVDGQWGRSTVDDSLAARYREDWAIRDIEVPVVTLAALLDEHPGPVDFLKIDVEGAERAVIEGADWSRHRPRVVLVEATEPGSPKPAHHGWEPMLLDAGYRCALFDGLNRFYAQSGDADALTALSAPANVFDDYEPYAMVLLREEARQSRPAEAAYIRRLEAAVKTAEEGRAELGEQLEEHRRELAQARRQAEETWRRSVALEHRVAELEAQLGARRS